jgi:serine/threonine protein phosphatase PrpC
MVASVLQFVKTLLNTIYISVKMDFKLWTDEMLKDGLEKDRCDIPYVKNIASLKNLRVTMEDKGFAITLSPGVHFYGVLDGHGGSQAVEHFRKVIPKEVGKALGALTDPTKEQVKEVIETIFLEEDRQWYYNNLGNYSGTTFTGALIFSGLENGSVYMINLGDSRTVVCLDGKVYPSQDHKPKSEIDRIKKAGGSVFMGRVNGEIAVSRALGDRDFKGGERDTDTDSDSDIKWEGDTNNGKKIYAGRDAMLSPIPDVVRCPFKKNMKIIMASDGLFDALHENEMVLDFLNEEDPCTSLVNYAKVTSADNIIVMLLDLSLD